MHQKIRRIFAGMLCIGLLTNAIPVIKYSAQKTATQSNNKVQISTCPSVELAVENNEVKPMRLAAENDFLCLYVSETTAEIALKSKSDGRVLWSNPQGYDTAALDKDTAAELESQVVLEYLNASQVSSTFTSKADCISRNQFNIYSLSQGARIEMTIGRIEADFLVPVVVSREVFEQEILAHIESGRDRSRLQAFYRLLSRENISENEYAEQIEKYPALKSQDIYVFRNGSDVEKKQLEKIIRAAGFTKERLSEAYKQVNYKEKASDTPQFKLAVEYLLEKDSLVARIDTSQLQYDQKKFILHSISLLPYFGAQNAELTEGELFAPDGSGALIAFGPKVLKHKQNSIVGNVYGSDMAISNNVFYGKKYTYYLPVFGTHAKSGSFMAILEDGAAVASISSFVNGDVNPFAGSTVRYLIQPSDNISEDSVRYTTNRYEGNCQIRYCLLDEGSDGYVGMAARYRRYLTETGVFNQTVKATESPLYLETLGTVQVTDQVAGINQKVTVPLSTFQDAQNMLEQFQKSGVSNLHLRYLGWCNGGLEYSAPSRLKVQSKLGGKSGLLALSEYTKQKKIGFYPDMDFRFVRKDGWFDGFTVNGDAVRQLDRTNALHTQMNVATLESDKKTAEYIITPSRLSDFAKKFTHKYDAFHISGLSVSSLGCTQTADYNERRATDAEEGMKYTKEVLAQLSGSYSLMTNGGNAYTWQYVTHIVSLPMENSHFELETESIPFMAMVLHGYRQFAGETANLKENFREAVLQSAETGGGLYVTLAQHNLNKLTSSRFTDYYSIDYSYWRQQVEAAMEELRQVQQQTYQLPITDHRKINASVVATTFGEKVTIYVNYGEHAQTIEGQSIPGKGMVAVHEN